MGGETRPGYEARLYIATICNAILCYRLILNGMELGLPRHKVAMVTSHALSLVSDYLGSDQCGCRCHLELSSAKQMMSLIRSCLSSKSALCALSNCELNHVASLLLQVLQSLHESIHMCAHKKMKEMCVQPPRSLDTNLFLLSGVLAHHTNNIRQQAAFC